MHKPHTNYAKPGDGLLRPLSKLDKENIWLLKGRGYNEKAIMTISRIPRTLIHEELKGVGKLDLDPMDLINNSEC